MRCRGHVLHKRELAAVTSQLKAERYEGIDLTKQWLVIIAKKVL